MSTEIQKPVPFVRKDPKSKDRGKLYSNICVCEYTVQEVLKLINMQFLLHM